MTIPSLKNIAILGCTGSIGKQTLDIARRLPERLRVSAIAAGSNAAVLAAQALEFGVSAIALVDSTNAADLDGRLPRQTERLFGAQSLEAVATRPDVDIVVVAVAGAIGTRATVAALLAGKVVALATKEVLVAAGSVVIEAMRKGGGRLIPIDSEHSGVFQCLQGSTIDTVDKVWLTGSGGPFRTWSPDDIDHATVQQALNHPTWNMGRKVTIDSATMMNKGLESIEAQWLFGLPIEKVGIVVHPQSKVHALVQYNDGSVIAQLGTTDMRLPIEYALLYPERIDADIPKLDVLKLGCLEFSEPDEAKFPCLRLARAAALAGGTAPAVLNASNEAAVMRFLGGLGGFTEIAKAVELALEHHLNVSNPSLEEILSADEWARQFVSKAVTV